LLFAPTAESIPTTAGIVTFKEVVRSYASTIE